jgi:putative CocE/NonD family hydrolase
VPSSLGGANYAYDRRPIQRRDDVLVYTSDVLTDPVEVIGNIQVLLQAASDARDTDFTAVITDVYPDGRSLILGPTVGIRRGRYRHGPGREELLTPGKVETFPIELYDIAHRFEPGHRIRIEISSSSAPHFNPNQNTGNPVATDTEWRVARQTVYHDRGRASSIRLPVLSRTLVP